MNSEKENQASTPESKRSERFKRWLSAPGIKFSSPEAKKSYREKLTRMQDALLLKEPDRVPVELPSEFYPAYYAGSTLRNVMYDYEEMRRAWLKYLHEFDADTYMAPGLIHSGRVLEIFDYKWYKWPGHGLAPDATSYQFIEGEYMSADEYDDLIRDPSDFALRIIAPRAAGKLVGLGKLPPLSAGLGGPLRLARAFADPDVQAALLALVEAGREMDKWREVVMDCSVKAKERGFPSLLSGVTTTAPFDRIADSLRGTKGVIMDMFRQPDKLLKALNVMTELIIQEVVSAANVNGAPVVFFPLHKGADGFMSQEQFNTFYWPTLKRVIMALIDEGIMSILSAQGSYMSRLEIISDLPRGWTNWRFHQTDMATAKKILGGTACISGNVPGSLLYTGTPEQVKAYCRNLIEVAGRDGGYMLLASASVEKANPANLRAMTEAAKEFGVYLHQS